MAYVLTCLFLSVVHCFSWNCNYGKCRVQHFLYWLLTSFNMLSDNHLCRSDGVNSSITHWASIFVTIFVTAIWYKVASYSKLQFLILLICCPVLYYKSIQKSYREFTPLRSERNQEPQCYIQYTNWRINYMYMVWDMILKAMVQGSQCFVQWLLMLISVAGYLLQESSSFMQKILGTSFPLIFLQFLFYHECC